MPSNFPCYVKIFLYWIGLEIIFLFSQFLNKLYNDMVNIKGMGNFPPFIS